MKKLGANLNELVTAPRVLVTTIGLIYLISAARLSDWIGVGVMLVGFALLAFTVVRFFVRIIRRDVYVVSSPFGEFAIGARRSDRQAALAEGQQPISDIFRHAPSQGRRPGGSRILVRYNGETVIDEQSSEPLRVAISGEAIRVSDGAGNVVLSTRR